MNNIIETGKTIIHHYSNPEQTWEATITEHWTEIVTLHFCNSNNELELDFDSFYDAYQHLQSFLEMIKE